MEKDRKKWIKVTKTLIKNIYNIFKLYIINSIWIKKSVGRGLIASCFIIKPAILLRKSISAAKECMINTKTRSNKNKQENLYYCLRINNMIQVSRTNVYILIKTNL